MTRNPAIHAPGVPSAESSAGLAAHRQRVMAENALADSQRHGVGARVEVRSIDGSGHRPARVLAAWPTTHYGWVYRVRFPCGREQKVTGQRLRPGKGGAYDR